MCGAAAVETKACGVPVGPLGSPPAPTGRTSPIQKAVACRPSNHSACRTASSMRSARRASRRPSPSRRSPWPTAWPAGTSPARPRPARARPSPSASPCSSGPAPGAPRQPAGLVLAPTRELALQITEELAPARHGRRRRRRCGPRRRADGSPDQRLAARRRRARRHPRAAHRPHAPRRRQPRRRPRRRRRRGRPHGRPRLPASGRVALAPRAGRRPDDAVLGHARRRRGSPPRSAWSTRPCTRSRTPTPPSRP